jgi:hypothetical protein
MKLLRTKKEIKKLWPYIRLTKENNELLRIGTAIDAPKNFILAEDGDTIRVNDDLWEIQSIINTNCINVKRLKDKLKSFTTRQDIRESFELGDVVEIVNDIEPCMVGNNVELHYTHLYYVYNEFRIVEMDCFGAIRAFGLWWPQFALRAVK